ncbi:MAG: GIY-YIG nuclease family protein [Gammaproteobacteria bacterium]|nr:GIY-YIG nuclease family protein [Gammaproteobacteria bacterium]
MTDMTDAELLTALGVDAETQKPAKRTPREERIIAGFEAIQGFVQEHDRPPRHGENRDIFERMYALRLDRIRASDECRALVAGLDHQGLLDGSDDASRVGHRVAEPTGVYESDAALLAELGMDDPAGGEITQLRFVKSQAHKRAAEEIASRAPCKDFDRFQPLFAQVQRGLDDKTWLTRTFRDNAEVRQGDWFILSGQKVFVAEMGDAFVTVYERRDRRLRVIYDNGTESDILMRSLQRALNKDPTARRIINTSPGPLFSGKQEASDCQSGTIYVLRSLSDNPFIAQHRDVLHKIGVTGGDLNKRIANARHDATFLSADIDVVATYELFNINRIKLETLIHTFFQPARLDIQIKKRFDKPVMPREWFLVPLDVIDEMVERLRDGSIGEFRYDVETASLCRIVHDRHQTFDLL